jgi:hypothetical protein
MFFPTTCTVITCWIFVGHKSSKRLCSETAGSHKKQGIGQETAAALCLPLTTSQFLLHGFTILHVTRLLLFFFFSSAQQLYRTGVAKRQHGVTRVVAYVHHDVSKRRHYMTRTTCAILKGYNHIKRCKFLALGIETNTVSSNKEKAT